MDFFLCENDIKMPLSPFVFLRKINNFGKELPKHSGLVEGGSHDTCIDTGDNLSIIRSDYPLETFFPWKNLQEMGLFCLRVLFQVLIRKQSGVMGTKRMVYSRV